MNRQELRQQLQINRVPNNIYNLDGAGRTDERFCIEFINTKWHVYFSERGVKTTECIFEKEEDACKYLYEQLVET